MMTVKIEKATGGKRPQRILVMNKEIKEEVRAFKETMKKCGLSWSREDIAPPENYEQQPPDQKEFVMLRAAERWSGYHQTLCENGEKDFADRYFPVGENGGRAMSQLGQIEYYLREEKAVVPETCVGGNCNWWDRTKYAVRNIFDLENSEKR